VSCKCLPTKKDGMSTQSTHPCDLVLKFLPVDALPAPPGARRVTPLRSETGAGHSHQHRDELTEVTLSKRAAAPES
jgi:hypothetical protein